MREVRTEHWACGRQVSARVPDDYDLSKGVAMVCHGCQDVWWFYPESAAAANGPQAAVAVPPAQVPSGEPLELTLERVERQLADARPGRDAAPAPQAEGVRPRQVARPARKRPTPDRTGRSGGGRARVPRAAPGVERWILPAMLLGLLALGLLYLADPGGDTDVPAPRRPPPLPVGEGATERTGPVTATVNAADTRFQVRLPSRWTVRDTGRSTLVSPGGRPAATVEIFAARRPKLTERRATALAVQALRRELPRAAIRGPGRVVLGGRPATRVSATARGRTREMTATSRGAYRFLVVLDVRPGATPDQAREARAVARSFRAAQ